MDGKDGLILDQLLADSRRSTALISRQTGIPRVTVHDRLGKLVQRGVIKKFTVLLDYAKLDLPISAFVLVSYAPSGKMNQHEVARSIGALPGVFSVYIISGEWDLLLKIRGRTIEDVGRLIVDKVRQVPGVHKTLTMACFETVKEE
ncbi:Lrp/AsnC family transcriptional regulator [Candidatus Micrarchaeota archaeon]|nr:Lrp/AsnC family transcriptional regulator [Candidatus Micrarchaeota archaeon]